MLRDCRNPTGKTEPGPSRTRWTPKNSVSSRAAVRDDPPRAGPTTRRSNGKPGTSELGLADGDLAPGTRGWIWSSTDGRRRRRVRPPRLGRGSRTPREGNQHIPSLSKTALGARAVSRRLSGAIHGGEAPATGRRIDSLDESPEPIRLHPYSSHRQPGSRAVGGARLVAEDEMTP